MAHCPSCTCDQLLDVERLLRILRHGEPHREVYRGAKSNRWFVTYGGGETDGATVRALLNAGQIRSVYNDDAANDAYHVGKTLDMVATLRAREGRKRKDGRLDVFTDGTSEVVPWK